MQYHSKAWMERDEVWKTFVYPILCKFQEILEEPKFPEVQHTRLLMLVSDIARIAPPRWLVPLQSKLREAMIAECDFFRARINEERPDVIAHLDLRAEDYWKMALIEARKIRRVEA